MQDFIIRRATADDAAALGRIYAYYVENTAVTFEYTPPSREEFADRIRCVSRKYPYLCVERGGELLGFAFAHAFRDRPAYDYAAEVSIYLRHDCRRCGMGSAVYLALEEALGRMGVRGLYACIAVAEEEDVFLTDASPRFHEALGYHTCGTFRRCGYKFGRWYTMIWMEKIIGTFSADPAPLIPYPSLEAETPDPDDRRDTE